MKIILDAMGGDNAPDATIRGAVRASQEVDSQIILVGNKDIINSKIKEFYGKDTIEEVSSKLSIRHATEQIEMEDIPTVAIKHKKDSSMVVGFNMLREDEGDVFISAGNSGALLTGATLLVGRIKGIDRPAIAPVLPAYHGNVMLMDAGANTNCKVINLIQFAQMADIYLQNVLGKENPRIGLLNIGTEPTKGNELIKETYQYLTEHSEELGINFIGNIEGRDCFTGEVDAVITDGFTGNVFLKTVEGFGKLVKTNLTESLKKNPLTMLGAIPAMPAINAFKKTMDYKEYGGALFLGVKKPVVKAHGSSDEYLFYFTIKQAERFVNSGATEKMQAEFENNQKVLDN
jgi:glycerol-3-phosphate acyltransferase PlsX